MKRRRHVFARGLLALLAMTVPVHAGLTYYVSPTGSDANNGLTEIDAMQTLQRAADEVAPGDLILVLPGVYAGARLEVSGAAGAPITLRAAAPGSVVLDRPGAAARREGNLEIETWAPPYVVSHWVIEGLTIRDAPRYGIDARSTRHLVLRDNVVSNSAVTGIFTPFSYDLLIEGNISSHNGEHGIYHNNSSDRFVIRGNTLHHNRHAGLHMNADASIAPPEGTPWDGDGVMSEGLVENNVIFLNGRGGAGINMDGVTHSLVRNNLIVNTTNNSGIALFRDDGAVASRCNRIVNNTVVMGASGGWALNLADVGCVSNQVFNNILYNAHGFRGSIVIPGQTLDGFESDYNVIVGRFSIDNGGGNINLTTWQGLGYDTHSRLATPADLFVDPVSNFQLRASSPAIDHGWPRPDASVDQMGVSRPLDGTGDGTNAWDIGAREYMHPSTDSDGDGSPDVHEHAAGTDATNALSRLAVTGLPTAAGTAFVLAWQSVAGRHYAVEYTTNAIAPYTAASGRLPATPPLNVHTATLPDVTAAWIRVALD